MQQHCVRAEHGDKAVGAEALEGGSFQVPPFELAASMQSMHSTENNMCEMCVVKTEHRWMVFGKSLTSVPD